MAYFGHFSIKFDNRNRKISIWSQFIIQFIFSNFIVVGHTEFEFERNVSVPRSKYWAEKCLKLAIIDRGCWLLWTSRGSSNMGKNTNILVFRWPLKTKIIQWSKSTFLTILDVLNFDFWEFLLEKFPKTQKFLAAKMVKMAAFWGFKMR